MIAAVFVRADCWSILACLPCINDMVFLLNRPKDESRSTLGGAWTANDGVRPLAHASKPVLRSLGAAQNCEIPRLRFATPRFG
jgi:hypothetical protein